MEGKINMKSNLVNLLLPGHELKDVEKSRADFIGFGENILDSESLTDKVYEAYLALLVKRFELTAANELATKRYNSIHISDVGILYKIGPYIPCVRRVSLVQNIDTKTDGIPGIRTVGLINDGEIDFYLIRPINKYPRHIVSLSRNVKKYKMVSFHKKGEHVQQLDVIYFGLKNDGEIVTPMECGQRNPLWGHIIGAGYPALIANAWADGKYHWIVETVEEVGKIRNVRLHLGVDKESIKSLFYARSMPMTETGRKRPILHWVRSHQRRIKEGIDVDVMAHLRGVTEFNMHGIDMRITQPDKDALKGADPGTVKEMFERLAEKNKLT